MFLGPVFTDVYANLIRCFLHPEILGWRAYTGSSFNFVTENDIKIISVAAAMFPGTPDPLPPASTLSDLRQRCKPEVETVPNPEVPIIN